MFVYQMDIRRICLKPYLGRQVMKSRSAADLLFPPNAGLHATVALTYNLEASFPTLTGYLCWRIAPCNERIKHSAPGCKVFVLSPGADLPPQIPPAHASGKKGVYVPLHSGSPV